MHTGWGDEKPLDCTRPLFIHPLELARAVYVSMDGRQHPQATGWGRQLWSKSVSWWLRWLCGQQPKQTGGRLRARSREIVTISFGKVFQWIATWKKLACLTRVYSNTMQENNQISRNYSTGTRTTNNFLVLSENVTIRQIRLKKTTRYLCFRGRFCMQCADYDVDVIVCKIHIMFFFIHLTKYSQSAFSLSKNIIFSGVN